MSAWSRHCGTLEWHRCRRSLSCWTPSSSPPLQGMPTNMRRTLPVLYDPEGARLAPLYDLTSTVVYPDLTKMAALRIGGVAYIDEVDDEACTREAVSLHAGTTGARCIVSSVDRLHVFTLLCPRRRWDEGWFWRVCARAPTSSDDGQNAPDRRCLILTEGGAASSRRTCSWPTRSRRRSSGRRLAAKLRVTGAGLGEPGPQDPLSGADDIFGAGGSAAYRDNDDFPRHRASRQRRALAASAALLLAGGPLLAHFIG